jgi:hypothetical protein
VTVTFEQAPGGTRLELQQQPFQSREARDDHGKGRSSSFDCLGRSLEARSSECAPSRHSGDRTGNTPRLEPIPGGGRRPEGSPASGKLQQYQSHEKMMPVPGRARTLFSLPGF